MENTKGNTVSVEDLLRQGKSAEELMQMLENELEAAQTRIDIEKKARQKKEDEEREARLESVRAKLVKALIEYCEAIGLTEAFKTKEETAELHDMVNDALKEYEEEFRGINKLLGTMIKPKRKKSQDMDIEKIIDDFIAKL